MTIWVPRRLTSICSRNNERGVISGLVSPWEVPMLFTNMSSPLLSRIRSTSFAAAYTSAHDNLIWPTAALCSSSVNCIMWILEDEEAIRLRSAHAALSGSRTVAKIWRTSDRLQTCSTIPRPIPWLLPVIRIVVISKVSNSGSEIPVLGLVLSTDHAAVGLRDKGLRDVHCRRSNFEFTDRREIGCGVGRQISAIEKSTNQYIWKNDWLWHS